MSDLGLTDVQREFQQLAKDFATREIMPVAGAFDKSGDFPKQILDKAWQVGLLNAQIPEDNGGLGLTVMDNCVIMEELSRGCPGIAASIEASNQAQLPVIIAGSPQQRQEFLTSLTEGAHLAGAVLLDENANTLTWSKEGDQYVLQGKVDRAINAGHALWYLVFATAHDAATSSKNSTLTGFIVPASADGLTIGKRCETLGRRAQIVCPIEFHKVRLAVSCRLGEENQGEKILKTSLVSSHLLSGACRVGLAQAALEHSIEYSKQRHTFGKPIGEHQSVGFMLADMAKDIEAARLLIWQGAKLASVGDADLKGASAARAFAQDMAMQATTNAVQIFGGYGYSKEYPVEKLMRDAKSCQMEDHNPVAVRVDLGKFLIGLNGYGS